MNFKNVSLNHHHLTRAVLPWLFLMLASCCQQTAKPPPDAYEPNDSITQAKPITDQLNGSLGEQALDFYSFSAKAKERILFKVQSVTGRFLSPVLEVQDLEGTLITGFGTGNSASNSDFDSGTFEVALPKDGQYVLKMQGFYTGPADSFCAYGTLDYQLKLSRLGTLLDPVVTVSNRTTSSVKFSWATVAGATGYLLERQEGAGAWKRLQVLVATSVSVEDTGLLANKEYVYRISSLLGDTSSVGAVITVMTQAQ